MSGRFGFAIVIADEGGHDSAIASGEAGHVSIEGQVFAVLVMAVMADGVADVMEEGPGFKEDAVLGGKMMHRLQAIKEENAEFANVFGVSLITFQSASEGTRTGDDLTGGGVIAVGFFSRESVVSDFLKNAFAEADSGDGHAADVQIAAEGEEGDGGDAHDVSTVASDAVGFHAFTDVAFEDVWETVAQEGEL